MTTDGLSRRHALTAAGIGLGLPLLAACGGGDSGGAGGASRPPAGGGSGGAGNGGGGGEAFASTSDIEVGGGRIFAQQQVVVCQPTEGDFKGFSSICTHQGCPVAAVEGGTIDCHCHGSKFSIEDGSVQAGPATAPLPQVELDVQGGDISLA